MTAFYPMYSYSNYALPNGTEPLVFLDFKNGIYTVNGISKALTDVIAQNTDFGTYTTAAVVNGTGLVGNASSGSNPVMIGDALSLVLGGCTALYKFTFIPADTHQRIDLELVDTSAYNMYYYSTSMSVDVNLGKCFIGDQVNPDVEEVALSVGAHRKAVTMIDGKVSRSTDGAATITINPAAAWSPAPGILHIGVGQNAILESVGLYPAQSDGDLPTLSAL